MKPGFLSKVDRSSIKQHVTHFQKQTSHQLKMNQKAGKASREK